MNKGTLIFVVICWCILTLIEYYLLPFFIIVLLWVSLSLGLLVVAIIQLIKLIKEQNTLSKLRIGKAIVFAALFYLTFDQSLVNGLIEKVDWKVFYNKRMDIVEEVKSGKLQPDGKLNNGVCRLPFKFPILSNGGNEIVIYQNKQTNTWTVKFWIFRNFFEEPSTQFIYTNDNEEVKERNSKVLNDPQRNWKIQDDWYRVADE